MKQRLRYKLIGNWRGVATALSTLPAGLQASAMWGQRQAAEKFAALVKENIKSNKVGGPAKKYNSSDGRSLINDGAYVDSIKAWRQNGVYYAGVKKGIVEPGSKIEIASLASIHEKGLGKMPARPVWEPSWKEFGGKRGAAKYVVKAIRRKAIALKLVGFTVNISGGLYKI